MHMDFGGFYLFFAFSQPPSFPFLFSLEGGGAGAKHLLLRPTWTRNNNISRMY